MSSSRFALVLLVVLVPVVAVAAGLGGLPLDGSALGAGLGALVGTFLRDAVAIRSAFKRHVAECPARNPQPPR